MQELNTSNYETEVENGVVVVKMWSTGCGPCKQLTPIMEQIETDNPGVKFGSLDIAENMDIVRKEGVRSVPTTLVYKDGVRVGTIIGVKRDDIVSAIQSALV